MYVPSSFAAYVVAHSCCSKIVFLLLQLVKFGVYVAGPFYEVTLPSAKARCFFFFFVMWLLLFFASIFSYVHKCREVLHLAVYVPID